MKIYSFLGTVLISLVSGGWVLTTNKPTAASTVDSEYAIVYSPLSNVRATPNGRIICQTRKKKTISVYYFTTGVNGSGSPIKGWYSTSACGDERMGWIHQSQIKLTGKHHPAP